MKPARVASNTPLHPHSSTADAAAAARAAAVAAADAVAAAAGGGLTTAQLGAWAASLVEDGGELAGKGRPFVLPGTTAF